MKLQGYYFGGQNSDVGLEYEKTDWRVGWNSTKAKSMKERAEKQQLVSRKQLARARKLLLTQSMVDVQMRTALENQDLQDFVATSANSAIPEAGAEFLGTQNRAVVELRPVLENWYDEE